MFSIGLMSGTSMDGIDAALIKTDGKKEVKPIGHISLPYEHEFKILLKAAELCALKVKGDIELAHEQFPAHLKTYLESLNLRADFIPQAHMQLDYVIKQSTQLHQNAVNLLLRSSQFHHKDIRVIGYHGQTLYHSPKDKISLQIGDGPLLAKALNIPVIYRFRNEDVAAGGEGAPFAPLYHFAMALKGGKLPLAVVNCGGISNITVIPDEHESSIIGFDTGPGNALIDRLVREHTNGCEHMDANGRYGKKGQVDADVLALLHKSAVKIGRKNYLLQKPPKSLDSSNLQLLPELKQLSIQDACATLETFTAQTIVGALKFISHKPKFWILTGGGWSNPVIRAAFDEHLKAALGDDVNIQLGDQIGWSSKALEAQVFAYLSVRSLLKMPISFPNITNVPQAMCGGEICQP